MKYEWDFLWGEDLLNRKIHAFHSKYTHNFQGYVIVQCKSQLRCLKVRMSRFVLICILQSSGAIEAAKLFSSGEAGLPMRGILSYG